MRYLVTHSLLSSWLHTIKGNPYEDATTEKDPMEDFMHVLRREPTQTTEAMQNGIDFEDLVTAIIEGHEDQQNPWYTEAHKIAHRCSGGILQYKAKKPVTVAGTKLLLYGRLDCLKAGDIIDIKFTKKYEAGKFTSSTQHPMYMELIPEARRFTYLISNGRESWAESYWREETPDIRPIIENFLDWLHDSDLWSEYEAHWLTQ